MSLFSRRTLQDLLFRHAPLLGSNTCKGFAQRLNSQESLPAQWELVLLNSFAKASTVRYEPSLGGQRRPDLHVVPASGQADAFIAEIVTVSDSYIRQLNPFDQFAEEFYRILDKAEVPTSGFDCEIGCREIVVGKQTELVLAVPTRPDYKRFFDASFHTFLRSIRENPGAQAFFERDDAVAIITIKYDPRESDMCWGFGSYDTDIWECRTSLYKALEDKYKKLRRSGFAGPMGVIACDGGAPIFRQRGSYHRITVKEVANEFLRRRPKMSFVTCISVGPTPYMPTSRTKVDIQSFFNELAPYPCSVAARSVLEGLASNLPKIQVDARHAQRILRHLGGTKSPTFWGVPFTWRKTGGKEIMILQLSARALLGLLGEGKTWEEFCQENLLVGGPNAHNPFRRSCLDGLRLVDVRLVRSEEDDDDWLEFQFEGSDPAATTIQAEPLGE